MVTAMTTMMVGMALPPMTDCGATTVDNGSDHGGSWDHAEARTMDVVIANSRSEDANPQGGDCHATGVVNALNCLSPPSASPVGRFAEAGKQ
jgi:hypothetical protein